MRSIRSSLVPPTPTILPGAASIGPADSTVSRACHTLKMLAITILYPRTDDSTFDMGYYTSKHMPMFAEKLGDACEGWGAATIAEGQYAAMGWAVVTSQDAFDATMGAHGAEILGDVPNYTNVAPELLVGEIAGGSQ